MTNKGNQRSSDVRNYPQSRSKRSYNTWSSNMEIMQSRGNKPSQGARGTARGVSIHIGLNHVDPNEYQDENGDPWDGELAGCINDARAMQEIAVAQGYKSTLLIDDQATSAQVLKSIGRHRTFRRAISCY
jgi:hypothetical protein